MFTRFETDFANVTASQAIAGAMVTLTSNLRLETPRGWVKVGKLQAGDQVATLDGGFSRIAWVSAPKTAQNAFFVPAGALGNCSDVVLSSETSVGMEAPLGYDATADHISLPIAAFEGQNGIRQIEPLHLACRTLGFDTEEMLWTQTGMLTHAQALADPFFEVMNFAEARGFLALVGAGAFAQPIAA